MSPEQARELLTKWCPPGQTLYTIVRHVGGMTSWIDVLVIDWNEKRILTITRSVADLIGQPCDTRGHDGIPMSGVGYNKGFQIVYELGSKLFPEGFACVGENCVSNDHHNCRSGDCPTFHSDGGYALRHDWI